MGLKTETDEQKREARYKQMTEAPLYPLLLRTAVPSMMGMLVSTVYSMTDTYFVGKLGHASLTAAVGIVYTFISVIQAVGFWFGYGSGNYISRMLGKRDLQKAEKMAATGVLLALLTGAVILAAGLAFVKPLAVLLGADTSPETLSATIGYLRITVVSVPFMLLSNVLYNELRLAGSGRDSMYGLLVGMVLNMILDPVFILGLHMDVEGAAFASMIGQIAGALFLFRSSMKDGNVHVHLRKARMDAFHIKQILKGGAPNFCRQGISSISSVLLNHAAGLYGDMAVAAVTIAVRVAYIGYALVIGFGQGFQPVCALNYGAGNYARIRRGFFMTLGTVTAFLLVICPLLYFPADELVMHFTRETDVAMLAKRLLRAQLLIMPFMGYYVIIGMLLQNIGRFGRATLVTISENGLFLIPAVLLLPRIFGLDGLIFCKPTASLLALLLSLAVGIRAWKKYL